LFHTSWWYGRTHQVHHRSTNPTSLANFAHHPVEVLVQNLYFILFLVLVPVHPMAFALVNMFVFGWGMVAHSGYELYPRGFSRHRAFGWINSSTHHNLHHSQTGCNYGMFFNWWDRLMATNHPAYRAAFDATRAAPATGDPYRATSSVDTSPPAYEAVI
jgi:sterol desaturase/sphingolipid hydroxylase (fatty acid hydroxylase superfamily)